jgi:iron complex outermembrane recepter protein
MLAEIMLLTPFLIQELPRVIVQSSPIIPNHIEHDPSHDFAIDAAELLRNTNAISGSRLGGHGIDPILRGQAQNRLNIILDQAYIFGGCPNRMDPPTAYANLDSYDNITIIKGVQSVLWGAGGSGGSIKFSRLPPQFGDSLDYRVKTNLGYKSNGDVNNFNLDAASGNNLAYLRGIVQYSSGNDYNDGDGNRIRSAFNTKSAYLSAGYAPNQTTMLQLSIEEVRESDILFAGSSMDAPQSDATIVRFSITQTDLQFSLYHSAVEHVMDNFSLRPLNAPMKMLADTESTTYGGRLSYDVKLTDAVLTLGLDHQVNQKQADRYVGMPTANQLNNLQSLMWGDIDTKQIGVFAQAEIALDDDIIIGGVRYDYITAQAKQANRANSAGQTPNMLFNQYYALNATKQSEHNLTALIRYETKPQFLADYNIFAGLSRSVRTADASERFMSATHQNPAQRWIGRPDIAPEQHYQFDLGLYTQQLDYDLNLSGFYNRVKDFILRDKAIDGASIYRNINADLYGFELDLTWKTIENLLIDVGLSYVRGHNKSDDRALAYIPPLEAIIGVNYNLPGYKLLLAGNLRLAAKQNRIDEQFDAGTSPSYEVLDLYASYNFNSNLGLQLGVDNVFDHTYAYHVNRANVDPFNPTAVRVNEPGRNWWLRFNAKF